MRDIFTEIYKKVLTFFQTTEQIEENTKDIARNRLKLVLMQDRTNLTPYLLERMRGEMIEVLSKYLEMDKEALELNFETEGESTALMLSIPVVRAREEEEINAILEAEDLATKENEEENEEDSEEDSEEEAEEDEAEDGEILPEEENLENNSEEDFDIENTEDKISEENSENKSSKKKRKSKKENNSDGEEIVEE